MESKYLEKLLMGEYTDEPIMSEEVMSQELNDLVEAPNAPEEQMIQQQVEQEKVANVVNRSPASNSKVEKELSPQEELLNEFKKYRKTQEDRLQAARQADIDTKFANNLNKGFQQIGQALASGYANPQMKAFEIKSNLADQVTKDDQAKLDNMLKEYKLLKGDKDSKDVQYFNTADGIVSVDKKTGETELLRESKLKKQREERLKDQFDYKKDVKSRLSDKEVEKIAAFDEGIRIFDQIDDLLRTTDVEKDLGPYASRAENMSDLIPGVELDEDFVKTQQLVGIQLADYIKSISGAAVSEEEAQRLLKNIPSVTDKPKAFKVKLDQIRKEIEEAKENTLKNIGKQKKSAEKFMDTKKKEDPKIKKFAQDYNLDYNRAERILRARGYDG